MCVSVCIFTFVCVCVREVQFTLLAGVKFNVGLNVGLNLSMKCFFFYLEEYWYTGIILKSFASFIKVF